MRHAIIAAALWICLFWAAPLRAHNATIFAWVDGETVHTESKFSGGRKARNAAVEVYDSAGTKLLEGKTDENGEFSFRIPRKTELKLVLVAGMGHQAEWTVPLDEISPSASAAGSSEAGPESQPAKEKNRSGPMVQSGPSVQEIRSVVEEAVDQKLAPVIRLLIESRKQGPSFSEIVGGIGYIVGLVGLAAYLHSRKKEKNGDSRAEAQRRRE
jgi:nickel transport protein